MAAVSPPVTAHFDWRVLVCYTIASSNEHDVIVRTTALAIGQTGITPIAAENICNVYWGEARDKSLAPCSFRI